jgi:hypothetical protein
MWDKNGKVMLARYKTFALGSDSYRLRLDEYSGTDGDALAYGNGQGRNSPNVSTIFLRLFLLQFFSKPIRMHQILPHEEELQKKCRTIVERFCMPSTYRGDRE